MYDVIVIGGGVIGGTVLRELTKYNLHVCLLEKNADVATGASCANSGIVHAGFDAEPGTLKAKFNVLGSKMMRGYCEELGVKYENCGALVVAYSDEEIATLQKLKTRGENNGVEKLEIISRERLFQIEPNVSNAAVAALYAPTSSIVCPYGLTIAAIGNAMDNGAELYTSFDAVKIEKSSESFTVTAADGRVIRGKTLINCAGIGSGKIAELAGDTTVKVYPRKGEYLLLDRENAGFVKRTLFNVPGKAGKGVLISPTADNNIIVGPTAREEGGTETTAQGLAYVAETAKKTCPSLPLNNVITSFAGVRAYCDRHDFIVEESACVDGLINCAGIESPGLTSAPAIAKYVVEELVAKKTSLVKNEAFHPYREEATAFRDLPDEKKNEIIAQNPAYGKIVCRCERVTEGEIVRAIRENPPARSIDAVKRRTRSGMGRCQGGFCQPYVAEILARELGIPFEEVKKSGEGSNLVVGATK